MGAPRLAHIVDGPSAVGDEMTGMCGLPFVRSKKERKYACVACVDMVLEEHKAMNRALQRVADMVIDVSVILKDER